jgi:hypothetical protein
MEDPRETSAAEICAPGVPDKVLLKIQEEAVCAFKPLTINRPAITEAKTGSFKVFIHIGYNLINGKGTAIYQMVHNQIFMKLLYLSYSENWNFSLLPDDPLLFPIPAARTALTCHKIYPVLYRFAEEADHWFGV